MTGRKFIWAISFHGFGIGVWSSHMLNNQIVWTVAIGPACVYIWQPEKEEK